MYLMALNNIDYIFITIFFAIIFMLAYLFRHKNSTVAEFFTGLSGKPLLWFGSIGIIEVILAGLIGARIGINAFYYLAIALCLASLLQTKLANRLHQLELNNFTQYVRHKFGVASSVWVAILNLMLFTCLTISAIIVTFKIFQSLLGWNFVNSIVGLLGITLIYILVGGAKAISTNHFTQAIIIILAFLIVVALGGYALHGINGVLHNLNQLATLQKLPFNYYLSLPPANWWAGLVLIILALATLSVLSYKQYVNAKTTLKVTLAASLTKFLIFALMVIPGIIAIATPINSSAKQFETIEAQMADGQTAYIIKSADYLNTQATAIPGIIPPLVNASTGLVEPNNYDYRLANIVAFRHYLPKPALSLLVIMLLAAFMYSVAYYLLIIARSMIQDILIPLQLLNQYAEAGKLWACRLTIAGIGIFSLFIAYFLAPYFNLFLFIYLMLSLIMAPLMAVMLLSLFPFTKQRSIVIPLIFGIAVGIAMAWLFTYNSNLIKYASISLISFSLTLITGFILNAKIK